MWVTIMANANWVCFDCRETVRRPWSIADDPKCPACGQVCRYVGTKISIPAKRNAKGWLKLRDCLRERRLAALERSRVARVRQQHRLEREIARHEALPKTGARTQAIRLLRKRLAELP
jgi:hypothetical protein